MYIHTCTYIVLHLLPIFTFLVCTNPRHIEDNGDWAKDCGELTDGFKGKIKSTFNVSSERAEKLYREMLQCMRRKHLVGGS